MKRAMELALEAEKIGEVPVGAVIADDNYNIVNSVDGSRIIYEKGREETIIEITEVK